MMHPSAFDEALCCPFIEEKPKKRWSMNSTVSNNNPNAVSISSLFGGDYNDTDLELGHLTNESRRQQQQGPIILNFETIVFDNALVRERHDEIISINQSMHQLHSISKDLGEIVDVQDDDIKRMSWFAIDAFEKTESSLEHLVRAAKFSEQYKQAQRRKYGLFMLLGVIVVLGFSRALMNDGDGGGQNDNYSNSYQHDNNVMPVIHIPSLHSP